MKTTIAEIKERYERGLLPAYPLQEIHSIFFILTEEYLGMTRLQLALTLDKEIGEEDFEKFEVALERLKEHEPIQYILGEKEFYGMRFQVDENVLIPRPETEELVEWIIKDYEESTVEGLRVLDIGTGSGCIAVSLAKHLPGAEVTAIDISKEALEVAKRNSEMNEVALEVVQMDILNAAQLPATYDIIVSNPPYVRRSERKEMRNNVLLKEPAQALWVQDETPLLFYEKITALAKNALTSKGSIYFEINEAFGKETLQLLTENNFDASLKRDIFGKDRMAKGTLKS